jgi:hypothetical protein
MTMNYERRNAVNRTRQFLVDIMEHKYKDGKNYHDLWYEARCCLKHFPGDYDMERAAEQSPEIFGEFEFYKRDCDE